MVDQPVDRRDGHRWVGENLVPFAEGLIAGGDQATTLVALGDEFEQDVGLGLVLAHIAEVVEHEDVEAVEFGQGSGQREIAPRRLKLLHEIGGPAEEDALALVDEGRADRGCEMRLAGAAGAEDQEITALLDPGVAS